MLLINPKIIEDNSECEMEKISQCYLVFVVFFFSMAILLNSCTIQIQINCGFNDLDVLVKL